MDKIVFELDGREYEPYQLSNKQILRLLKSDDLTDTGHETLMRLVMNRFEYDLCPKAGEGDDEVFARFFSNYVNNCGHDRHKAAEKTATDHRTLQSNMFDLCMAYIKELAESYENGWYDARNEYAVTTSKMIIDHLKEMKRPY